MLLDKLLDHFDTYEILHIDVNDVRDQIVALGIQDEIRFHFVKMDAAKIRGLLHRYKRSDGVYTEPVLCSDIIIPVEMGDEDEYWQRLVAVKELIHITDGNGTSAQSEEAVDNLFEQFSLPPEMRDGFSPEIKTSFLNDRVRIYVALAVLVPQICRDHLRGSYPDNLNDREIAEIAKIPSRYVSVIMNPDFDEFIEKLCGWEKEVD